MAMLMMLRKCVGPQSGQVTTFPLSAPPARSNRRLDSFPPSNRPGHAVNCLGRPTRSACRNDGGKSSHGMRKSSGISVQHALHALLCARPPPHRDVASSF
jgi:hypothetical protein